MIALTSSSNAAGPARVVLRQEEGLPKGARGRAHACPSAQAGGFLHSREPGSRSRGRLHGRCKLLISLRRVGTIFTANQLGPIGNRPILVPSF